MDPLLTSVDVAKLLGVPTRTLDSWAYKGVGPAHVRVGRYRRYRPVDVAAWVEDQRRNGRAPATRTGAQARRTREGAPRAS